MAEWEMWKDALRVFFETRNDTMCFVIVCFGIGAIVAAFAAFAEKNGVGRLVRYLLQSGATDPDSAQTLKSAGLAGSPFCVTAPQSALVCGVVGGLHWGRKLSCQ